MSKIKSEIKPLFERLCKVCGSEYKTPFPKSKHCSDTCKQETIRREQRAKYFRRRARNAKTEEERVKYEKQAEYATKGKTITLCEWCNKPFEHEGTTAIKYCSDECRQCGRRLTIDRTRSKRTKSRKKKSGSVESTRRDRTNFVNDLINGNPTVGIEPQLTLNQMIKEKEKELAALREELALKREGLDKIDPYYLKRGDVTRFLKNGRTAISGNA